MKKVAWIILSALFLGACTSAPIKETTHDNACETAKGKLDDFGPGVEKCRQQNAPRLDDLSGAK